MFWSNRLSPLTTPLPRAGGICCFAEHLTLEKTLAAGGVSAALSRVVDVEAQRFLELERFDRVSALGRHALLSLASLDGEFVGNATARWPVVTAELARQKAITAQAHASVALLFAFGTLIGNTDMHAGNLSFVSDHGRPYALSPAYDMLPMTFKTHHRRCRAGYSRNRASSSGGGWCNMAGGTCTGTDVSGACVMTRGSVQPFNPASRRCVGTWKMLHRR